MYRLYNVVKNKTNILGVWKDNNKIYYDNIEIKEYTQSKILDFEQQIRNMFSLGEICIAYKYNNNMVLEYSSGKKEILKNRIEIKESIMPSKEYIEILLKNNSGITIYKERNYYIIEIYK